MVLQKWSGGMLEAFCPAWAAGGRGSRTFTLFSLLLLDGFNLGK